MNAVQRVNLQPAYLLHQRAYRDTSLILDVLTPEYGRIALVAKGVRQEKSKLKGVLRLFQPLVLSWSGRGEMGTLTGAEAQGRALELRPEILPCGFYLNELVIKLLHQHDPHIELFSHYDETLRQLATITSQQDTSSQQDMQRSSQSQKAVQVYLRHFEVALLQVLGYALLLEREYQSGESIVPDREYCYDIDAGPSVLSSLPDDGAGETSNGTTSVTISGAALLALKERSLSLAHEDEIFRQTKRLMRVVLDHYLGHKPLHSRQLMSGQRKMQVDALP